MDRNGTLRPSQRNCNNSMRNQRFEINTTYHGAANEIIFIIRTVFFLYHWQVLTKNHLAKRGMSLCSFTQLVIIPARPSCLQQQFGYNCFFPKHFEHVFRQCCILSPSDQGVESSLHDSETPFLSSGVQGVHFTSLFCFLFSPFVLMLELLIKLFSGTDWVTTGSGLFCL